jgi:hypothetical protein
VSSRIRVTRSGAREGPPRRVRPAALSGSPALAAPPRCWHRALGALTLLAFAVSSPLLAQEWNDDRTRALVRLATERRARQLADTGLRDYTASAHGYLTFLAQVGEGFPDPPKVVKADELALEVYWRAPNHSKQMIVGRRDTLLLPTDIAYHRDHLGIVQNNFPDIIRLGDGDEVRDVPHPLSWAGMDAYDFAIRDSLRIGIPGRVLEVYEVRVRPRDDRAAAAVGAVYLSRGDAQVVRMAFSFTRAALIDRQLEDVSIVLDNVLFEERYWLPRRQEIEIRRTGSWLDFPARGIIRGRWEICCYAINRGLPADAFAGPEIDFAPPARRAAHRWDGAVLDSLPPEVRAATDEDVQRVQTEARALVRAEALARSRDASLAAPALSQVIRFSRAEGLSLGVGVRRRLGAGFELGLAGRYGMDDEQAKGQLALRWEGTGGAVQIAGYREYREAGDVAETSGIRNSIAAQEFGSDYTEPYDARGLALTWESSGQPGRRRYGAQLAHERLRSVTVVTRPARGRFEPVLAFPSVTGLRLSLTAARGPRPWLGGELRESVEGRVRAVSGDVSYRAAALYEYQNQIGAGRIRAMTFAGAVSPSARAPDLVLAGGPLTGPGYRFHQFASTALLWQRLEWQYPIPFAGIRLGRWGRVPGRAQLAPYAHVVCMVRVGIRSETAPGCYPALGMGLSPFFELLRFDVARGLRGGRWTFGVDVSRDFWRIL